MIDNNISNLVDDARYPAIPHGSTRDKLLKFLKLSFCKIDISTLTIECQEERINQEMCSFLSDKSCSQGLPIEFCHEYKLNEDNDRAADISVRIRFKPNSFFFVIEGKRLYKKAGKDYVCGNTGGIERFKKNLHGNGMPMSAMLGYVQDHDFCDWHQKINSWIDDEVSKKYAGIYWKANEKLKKLEFLDKNKKVTECISVHPRKDNADITLIHFWLDFKKL